MITVPIYTRDPAGDVLSALKQGKLRARYHGRKLSQRFWHGKTVAEMLSMFDGLEILRSDVMRVFPPGREPIGELEIETSFTFPTKRIL
jgi:hypothetical protein